MKVKKVPCRFCGNVDNVRKHGSGKSTKMQRYYCTHCVKTFQVKYIYNISQPKSAEADAVKASHYTEARSNYTATANG